VNRHLVPRILLVLVFAIVPLAAFLAPEAAAVTYRPIAFDDYPLPTGCFPDPCSLREAVVLSESNSTADTIVLGAGTYTLSLPISGSESGASAGYMGDLDITKDLTIVGAGAGATIIDAQGIDRVFDIAGGANVTIRGVTIVGGSAQSSNVAGHEHGGGIHNHGTLVLQESTLADNEVLRPRGAVPWGGGGLTNAGQATITNVSVLDNAVPDWLGNEGYGGGIENIGILDALNTTVAYNSATYGGGIAQRSQVAGNTTLKNTIVKWNTPGDCWGSNKMLSLGTNLFGSCVPPVAAGAPGDRTGDPLFGSPYTTAAGTRYLFPLQAGSPAVDAANNYGCPAVDELWTARPLDGNGDGKAVCDIGAFELAPTGKHETAGLGLSFGDIPPRTRVWEEFLYRLVVVNLGSEVAEDVVLEHVLPAELEVVKLSDGCEGERSISCRLDTLEPDSSVEVEIVVRPTVPGTFELAASVSSRSPDPDAADNVASAKLEVEG
jgi:hypothetical protein